MNWFFDKDDDFVVSLNEFCKNLPDEKPVNTKVKPWNKGKKGLQVAWNKGLKMPKESLETRERKSKSLTGRTLSEEHKRKIGEANAISKLGSIPWNKGKRKIT